jgi:hypothetical protein
MIKFTTKNLTARLACLFSNKNSLINAPPIAFEKERPILKENIWRVPDLSYKVSMNSYRNHKKPISATLNI